MIGRNLSHFEITAKLGEGGMGEVYRAVDSKLGREVAIKVLPEAYSSDPERLARFEREAKMLASLNHSNIAGIYDVDEAKIDDSVVRFLVMELAPGETLAERLSRGPIPGDEVLAIAQQIAEALEAAHGCGIVHRDLKPANIKITQNGEVKVLDFGLAKTWEVLTETSPDLADSPTLTAQMTQAGVILGTAAYMSPEQARGQEADQRADIWSFGVVLYEMLTGEQLFGEPSVSETLAAVLRAEVDWQKLPEQTSPGLRRLLRRCLERDPRGRLHAAADARLEIDEVAAGLDSETAPKRVGKALYGKIAIAAVAGAALTALVMSITGSPGRVPMAALSTKLFELVEGVGVEPSNVYSGLQLLEPKVSPDGSMVVYPAAGRLWIRDLTRLEPRPLEGTEGARDAFWSPDSKAIAYVVGSELRRLSAEGGPSIVLANLQGLYIGGTWGRGSRPVVAIAAQGLFEVPTRDGEPRLILPPDRGSGDFDFHAPTILAESGTLAFVRHSQDLLIDTVEFFDGRVRKEIYRAPGGAQLTGIAFDPSSNNLLVSIVQANAGLWAIPLDPASGDVRGEASLVVAHGLAPSVAADGTLVYVDGLRFEPERLARVDHGGTVIGEVGQALWDIRVPVLSPDGGRVATRARHEGSSDLWVHDLDRETALRVTSDPIAEIGHAWADGGESLVYATGYGDVSQLLHRRADGSGEAELLLAGQINRPSLPVDGSFVVYQVGGARLRRGQGDLWWFPIEQPEAAEPLLATPADEVQPAVSPDGRFLAYTSDQSGQKEVYLQPLPGGTRMRVSTRGGELPVWSRNGNELYYVADSTLMAVPVDPDNGLLGLPARLFSGSDVSSPLVLGGAAMFTIGPDDDFLIVRRQLPGEPVVVALQNWTALLNDE